MLSARRNVTVAKRFFKKMMRADHPRLAFSISVDKKAAGRHRQRRDEGSKRYTCVHGPDDLKLSPASTPLQRATPRREVEDEVPAALPALHDLP